MGRPLTPLLLALLALGVLVPCVWAKEKPFKFSEWIQGDWTFEKSVHSPMTGARDRDHMYGALTVGMVEEELVGTYRENSTETDEILEESYVKIVMNYDMGGTLHTQAVDSIDYDPLFSFDFTKTINGIPFSTGRWRDGSRYYFYVVSSHQFLIHIISESFDEEKKGVETITIVGKKAQEEAGYLQRFGPVVLLLLFFTFSRFMRGQSAKTRSWARETAAMRMGSRRPRAHLPNGEGEMTTGADGDAADKED